MKIRIGKYTVTSDGHHNFIVNESVKTKPREGGESYERLQAVGYFSKLEHFCEWILEQRILKSKAQSIEELRLEIMASKAEIIEEVQGIKVGRGQKSENTA